MFSAAGSLPTTHPAGEPPADARSRHVVSRMTAPVPKTSPLAPAGPSHCTVAAWWRWGGAGLPVASLALILAVLLGGGAAADPPAAPAEPGTTAVGVDAGADPAPAPAVAESPAAPVNPLTELESLRYQPAEPVSGTLRLAGSTTLEHAAASWADDFTRLHPDASVALEGGGSENGWRKLLTGEADVALVSRPLTAEELAAAEQELPERRIVAVAVGYDALVWIVHTDNPIPALPWSPECGVLKAASATASPGVASRWAELDGTLEWPADWESVAIQPHATGLDSGTRWHLDRLATGRAACPLDVQSHPTTADVAAAVAADRGGLGLVSGRTAWPGVRRVPLEIPADAAPLPDAVIGSDRPPNLRPLFIVVALPRDAAPPALLREFLAYVLSYSGQLDVAKDGLLPLSRAELHAQRELLGWSVER